MRSIVRASALIIVGCIALRGAAAGTPIRTVHVPQDFPTIQQAVSSLGSFGIVDVAPGSYGPFTVGHVSDLTIRGGGDAVIDGGADPAVTVLGAERIVLEGFTVTSLDSGVRIVETTDVVVRGLTVRSAGLDGIHAETVTRPEITGNRIESAGGRGIDVITLSGETSGALDVTQNTVVSAGSDGICIQNLGDGADMVVTGNTVESAGGRGIATECGMTLDLSNNDVRATGGAGISIHRVVDRTTVRGNTVADTGGPGVAFDDGQRVVVAANHVDRTAGDGVSVTAAVETSIARNSVTDAGSAGIRVESTFQGGYEASGGPVRVLTTVASNDVVNPAGSGIVLDHANPGVVSGNSVADPGVHGVELDATNRVRVLGNDVTGAGSCGFRLVDGARGNVLKRNKAFDCAQGLFALGAERKANRIAASNRFRARHAPR